METQSVCLIHTLFSPSLLALPTKAGILCLDQWVLVTFGHFGSCFSFFQKLLTFLFFYFFILCVYLFILLFCFFFTFKPPCAFYCCVHFSFRQKLSILRCSTGARIVIFLCVQWLAETCLENFVHSFRALRYLHGLFLYVFYFYYYFVSFSLLNPHALFTAAYIFLFVESFPSYGLRSVLGSSLFSVSSDRRKLASRIPSILSAH